METIINSLPKQAKSLEPDISQEIYETFKRLITLSSFQAFPSERGVPSKDIL